MKATKQCYIYKKRKVERMLSLRMSVNIVHEYVPISGYVTTHTTPDPVLNAFMDDLFRAKNWYIGKFKTFGLASSMTKYLKSLSADQWVALRNFVHDKSYQGFVDQLKGKYSSH
jgi:hypothetical protein